MPKKQKGTKAKKTKASQSIRRSSRSASKSAARAAGRGSARRRTLIRDVMTAEVEYLRPTDTAAETARRMRDLNVGAIPVCEDSRLVGVVTDRDITIRVTAEGRDPNTIQLQEFLSQDLVTAEPDWSTEEAASVMAEHQIRRLPVVEQGKLVGIVSLGDLAAKTQKAEPARKALKEISKPAAPSTRS